MIILFKYILYYVCVINQYITWVLYVQQADIFFILIHSCVCVNRFELVITWVISYS